MKKRISLVTTAVVAGLAIFVIAGCGSSSSGDSGSSTSSSSSSPKTAYGASPSSNTNTTTSAPTAIDTAKNPKLGPILVDSNGNTLYLFKKDKGGKSACYGACATAWPPVTTSGSTEGGTGTKSSLLGTAKRTDGTTQVTYNNWPLYLYEGDAKPGDTNGNDFSQFGAQWYAVTPAGAEAPN